jgi:hypothetical protein
MTDKTTINKTALAYLRGHFFWQHRQATSLRFFGNSFVERLVNPSIAVLALRRAPADEDKITKWVNIAPHPADGSIASEPPVEELADKEPLAENKTPPTSSRSCAEPEATADSPELASVGDAN